MPSVEDAVPHWGDLHGFTAKNSTASERHYKKAVTTCQENPYGNIAHLP
jgi:hypothetical protein